MYDKNEMTIGNWIATNLIMCIPLVGFIMLIVWAVSDSTKPSKKTWAISQFVMVAIYIAIMLAIYTCLLSAGSMSMLIDQYC